MAFNEYELIYLFRYEYNEKAFQYLAKKYENIIRRTIYEYNLTSFNDDVYQVGLITLNRCVELYDMDSNYPFLAYFITSLKRMAYRYRQKENYPYYSEYDDNLLYDRANLTLSDNVKYYEFEGLKLNSLESDAMNEIFMGGCSFDDFSKKHNINIKKVYNLVYRLKLKLRQTIKFN